MLEGKGYYLWRIRSAENGDPQKIAEVAKQAGLKYVILKVADGIYRYNIHNMRDLVPPVVNALKAVDIDVWGYQYIYGKFPKLEAKKANSRAASLGLDGWVINGERELKDNYVGAATYMANLNVGIPVALSTYRFPLLHMNFPFKAFKDVDVMMPQVYWMGADNAGEQLEITMVQYINVLKWTGPIVPTGFAFIEHGYKPQPIEVTDFLDTAKELNLPSVNFWEWANTRTNLPLIWQLIADYDYNGATPPPNVLEVKLGDEWTVRGVA